MRVLFLVFLRVLVSSLDKYLSTDRILSELMVLHNGIHANSTHTLHDVFSEATDECRNIDILALQTILVSHLLDIYLTFILFIGWSSSLPKMLDKKKIQKKFGF